MVARALHEESRSGNFAQNLVAHLFRIATAAERIAQTNERGNLFAESAKGRTRPAGERDVTANSAAHAFADQDNWAIVRFAGRIQRGPMRCD